MIPINKRQKEEILKWFPKTEFNRTCSQKSKRGRFYICEEKDQLRFLSGMPKTQKDHSSGAIVTIIPGSIFTNDWAIKAFEILLINNIKYYNGEIGGMNNNGDLLNEAEVTRSVGLKKFCEFELGQLRKKHKNILKK